MSDIDADVAKQPDESEESETSLRSSQAVHSHDDGSRFRAVKGTVLLHLSFATKQDQVGWMAGMPDVCMCACGCCACLGARCECVSTWLATMLVAWIHFLGRCAFAKESHECVQ